jgi:hypothetical protein
MQAGPGEFYHVPKPAAQKHFGQYLEPRNNIRNSFYYIVNTNLFVFLWTDLRGEKGNQ